MLPQMKPLMDEAEFKRLSEALETCDSLSHLDEHVYIKMYGYRDK